MQIIEREELPEHRLVGRIIQKAVGREAAARSERMTMGFARYSDASGPMEPHCHAEETIFVLAAEEGWVRCGPAKDDLPHRFPLRAGQTLHIPALEWHVFEHRAGGHVDIIFFYGQVDDIRPEDQKKCAS
jgi:hypothetical protein